MNESELRRLFRYDRYASLSGIDLAEVSEGHAKTRMEVTDHHLNGVDVAQGGAVFTLADLAFAAACNSHGTVAVAINVSISFVKAARKGVLTAEATEVSVSGRISSVTVHVTDSAGDLVAIFQGTAYRKKETIAEFLAAAGR